MFERLMNAITGFSVDDYTEYDVSVGLFKNADEVIAGFARHTHVVGASAERTFRSPEFVYSEPTDIKLVCVTPRQLGLKAECQPWVVLANAVKQGLAPCPDDAAACMMMRWGLSSQGHLFAVRHIQKKMSGCWFMQTNIDLGSSALGLWHGQRGIPLDKLIFFRKP